MNITYSPNVFLLWLSLFFSSMLMSHTCAAIELNADILEQQLKIEVSDINYPKQMLMKQLNSGLTNNISVLLSLQQGNTKIFVSKINYQITYDLWDEVYKIVVSSSFNEPVSKVIDNRETLLRQLNQLNFSNQEAFAQLQPEQNYQVSAQVLVNPIATERINKIRTWIATSQGYSLDPEQNQLNKAAPITNIQAVNEQKTSLTRSSARPRFQKLFDQLLEQHLASADTPALWRSDVAKVSIRRARANNEK